MELKKYKIGEKNFIQKPLVLGQIDQLINLMRDALIPNSTNPIVIQAMLGNKLPKAFAIVLVEEGKSPKRNNDELDALADEINFGIHADTSLQVIEDFFVCNPVVSLLTKLAGLAERLSAEFQKMQSQLQTLSSSSQAATSQNETTSSGATPPESASPSPNTGSGK